MNNKLTDFWRKLYQEPFKRYLVISLIILGGILLFTGQEVATSTAGEGFGVHFFYLPGCSHCDEQKPFNDRVTDKYARYCKPIGGTVLLILGVLLLFAPHLLP